MENLNLDSTAVHPLVLYRNHLEFHGYRVEESDQSLTCRHPRKTTLFLNQISSRGVNVRTAYSLNPSIDRVNVLEYINHLNAELLFLKAWLYESDTLFLDTFSEGSYDRTTFSTLLDNFEFDMEIFWSDPLTDNYLE